MWGLAIAVAGIAQAQSWDLAGSSLRDVGMAGAGAAGDLPGAAIPVDPASLAAIDGELGTISWRGSFPAVQDSNDADLVTDAVHAVDFGIGVARPLGDQAAVAGGFQWYLPVPNAVETLVRMNPDDAQAPLLDDAADFTTVNAAVALKVAKLEVGLGVSVGMKVIAETDIRLLSLSGEESPEGFDVTESVALDSRRTLKWSGAPLVGLHYRDSRWNAFASWRGSTGFETTGDQTLRVVFPFIEIDPVRIPVTYLSAWSPARLTVGGNAVLGAVQPEAALRYVVGAGFADSQMRAPESPFRNVVSPALGLHFIALEGIALRTGYSWVPTVVPVQDGQTNLADADRHVVGLGTSLTLQDVPRDGDIGEFNIATQLQVLPERSEGFGAKGTWLTTTVGMQVDF